MNDLWEDVGQKCSNERERDVLRAWNVQSGYLAAVSMRVSDGRRVCREGVRSD